MLRVFIADDSPLVRERLRELIGDLGTADVVGQAGDARTALAAIQRLQPDVVILDIRMPSGSGFQALEALKQGASAPIVVMLTAFPYPQHRKRCLEAGADYFFDKTSEFHRVPEVLAQLSPDGQWPAPGYGGTPRKHGTQPLVARTPLLGAPALAKRRSRRVSRPRR